MRQSKVRTASVVFALPVTMLVAAGCGSGGVQHSEHAVLSVDRPVSLADAPVRLRFTGLRPGEEVTAGSSAVDARHRTWTGKAVLTADKHGVIDLDRDASKSGTYRGVDAMGLFWSMTPRGADPVTSWFQPPKQTSSFSVRITLRAGDRTVAAKTLTRTTVGRGVRHTTLTEARDQVSGELYLPPAGARQGAPVLLLGGSEGGVSYSGRAALLASRGHPALAVCYFGCQDDGPPKSLERIPMEYFATAARVLDRRAGAAPGRTTVVGASRGTEPAQLLVQDYPELVRNAVVFAPSARTGPGYPHGGVAWTKDGKPAEAAPIPLDNVRGSVLAVAGADDKVWDSATSAQLIASGQSVTGVSYRALVYPGAGHGVTNLPYFPSGTVVESGAREDLGGTRAGNARAAEQSWPQALKLMGD